MQTLDPLSTTPDGALASPAAARNAGPILEVLRAHLPALQQALGLARLAALCSRRRPALQRQRLYRPAALLPQRVKEFSK